MAQRTENPAFLVSRWYNPEGLNLTTASAGLFLHSDVGYTHFKGELRRSQDRRLARNPELLNHYLVCSWIAEFGDMLKAAQEIPIIGRVLPGKETILIPAVVIATAALAIECQKRAAALQQKRERVEQRRQIEFGETVRSTVYNRVFLADRQPLSSIGGSEESSPISSVSGPILRLGHVVKESLSAIKEGASTYVSAQLTPLDLRNDEKELGQHYYLLLQTLLFDEHATYDALIRMNEHLETIQESGSAVLERVFEHFQTEIASGRWIFDGSRGGKPINLRAIAGKGLGWVTGAWPLVKKCLGELAPDMPQGELAHKLRREYIEGATSPPLQPAVAVPQRTAQRGVQPEASERGATPPPLQPAVLAPQRTVQRGVQPEVPEKGGSPLLWLSLCTFSFWLGRRLVGGERAPTPPIVPT